MKVKSEKREMRIEMRIESIVFIISQIFKMIFKNSPSKFESLNYLT